MFARFSRNRPGLPKAEESHQEGSTTMDDQLVPVSVLALDMPARAGGSLDLSDVAVTVDDLGRPAVSRADARLLLAEYRAVVAREAERLRRHREEAERLAVERDEQFRAQLHPGLPASMFAEGENPIAVQIAAEKAADPRRRSMQEELWDRQFARRDADEIVTVYHPLPRDGGES